MARDEAGPISEEASAAVRESRTWEPATGMLASMLFHIDSLIYALVGLCFFAAALLSLGYGVAKFIFEIDTQGLQSLISSSSGATAIITFVSDLLLTLIIMEVLGTVVHYLRTRETSLKPFLFIGIISATRGILAVGARLSIEGASSTFYPNDFKYAMIELGVNAIVIIALGMTLRLIGKYLDEEHQR